MNGDAWTEAQRKLCLAHPDWPAAKMAAAVSKVGPKRTIMSVKAWRRQAALTDAVEIKPSEEDRADRRRQRRMDSLALAAGWPKPLGDEAFVKAVNAERRRLTIEARRAA